VPFVKTPPGPVQAGDSSLSWGNIARGSDEGKSSWCEKLGSEKWKQKPVKRSWEFTLWAGKMTLKRRHK